MKEKLKEFVAEKRAVSPVIGVVLMVAVVVILAAVIGAFVLGLGSDQQASPQASFSFEEDTNGNLIITHDGGDRIPAAQLEVRKDGKAITGTSWEPTGPVQTGSTFTTGATAGSTYHVIWIGDGGKDVPLGTYTVPGSSDGN